MFIKWGIYVKPLRSIGTRKLSLVRHRYIKKYILYISLRRSIIDSFLDTDRHEIIGEPVQTLTAGWNKDKLILGD